jgi:hypothetical protein
MVLSESNIGKNGEQEVDLRVRVNELQVLVDCMKEERCSA